MKNKSYFLIPAAILAVPLLMACWYVFSFGYSWDDAWSSVRHFGGCKTRYAQKFNESNLSRIRPGMKGNEVFNLIGAPMEGHLIDGQPAPVWKYSLPKEDAAYYHERAVLFDLPAGKPPTVKSVVRRLRTPDTEALAASPAL